ncbi:hypothetical protein Vadar_019365 [Vaccinium darrowii]|uniref:Uncharacterized protein n=1 Tax=Vaccinium darrowii TaxID=229202 RepID=A0ACB7XBI2_9ERIC|nr:hypothetical protein Vadar_019365 [Vaccinium darrowii]
MAEENHPSQNEPETVPLADHIALQREVENLQAMVQHLLAWDHPNTGLSTPLQSTRVGASVASHLPSNQLSIGQSIPHPFIGAGAAVIQNPSPIQNHTGAVPLPIIPNSPGGIDPIINLKIKHLEEALKAMKEPNAYPSTNFSDLCFFPNQPLPAKFKIPDFTKFNGTTNPMTHLRLYVGALNGLPNGNMLMMQLFQHSLTGPAAQWFARLDLHRIQTWAELSQEFVKQYRHNTDIGIDRMHLLRIGTRAERNISSVCLALEKLSFPGRAPTA